MNVSLTPELESFVAKKVESGRYSSASEVVREALRLLADQEALRATRLTDFQAELDRRLAEAEHQRVTLPGHRPPRGQGTPRPDPHPEEKAILAVVPEIADYLVALKQRTRKVLTLALRQLLRLVREYPPEPLLAAVREAARYGLYDLDRLERMILRRVAREYFLLKDGRGGGNEDQ